MRLDHLLSKERVRKYVTTVQSSRWLKDPAAIRSGETPVPMPNTTVKTRSADGTALETVRESRWPPVFDFKKAWTHLENRIYESISFFTKVKKHAQTKDRDNEEEHESVPKLNIFCNVLSDFAGERKLS